MRKIYNSAIENKCDVVFSGIKLVNNKSVSYLFTQDSKVYLKYEVCKYYSF